MDNTLRVEARPGQVLNLERFASLLENEATKFSPKAENKLAELIADQNNNLWLFTDSSDKIIWGQGYDEETKKVTPVPDSFQDLLTPDSPLLRHPDRDTTLKGMIILPEGPMLVVSVAVLNQKSDGTIEEGSMIMGRYLDSAEIARLAEQTQLGLAVRRLEGELPPDFQDARSSLSESESTPIHVEPLSGESIAGYTVLSDIAGESGLLLRADMSRDIKEEGDNSMFWLLISLIVVGVVLVVLIAFLLDRLVLSRMARLNTQVSDINTASDLSAQVSIPGNNELSNLGGAINGMLGEIQTERGKSEALLLNVLPQEIANRLKQGENTIADSFSEVSVLFADVVDFTGLSARISPTELVGLLNQIFSAYDRLSEQHGLEKNQDDSRRLYGGRRHTRSTARSYRGHCRNGS